MEFGYPFQRSNDVVVCGKDLALDRKHRLGGGNRLGNLPRGAEPLGLVP
jgi:hypothetical protein